MSTMEQIIDAAGASLTFNTVRKAAAESALKTAEDDLANFIATSETTGATRVMQVWLFERERMHRSIELGLATQDVLILETFLNELSTIVQENGLEKTLATLENITQQPTASSVFTVLLDCEELADSGYAKITNSNRQLLEPWPGLQIPAWPRLWEAA